MNPRFRGLLSIVACVCASIAWSAAEPAREPLIVFAAASLTDSLQKVSDAYTRETGVAVKLSFASTSALARQIESGARADVFVSADQEWMDYLAQRKLISERTRTNLLANRLALIAPQSSNVDLQLGPNASLASALGENGRLAIGDPDFVPAGKYARAALESLGLWRQAAPRLARAENVRVALSYVARGEAPLGIVYSTDAAVEPRVRIVALLPEQSHPPITYPAASTRVAGPQASSFLSYLRSHAAQAVFRDAGFVVAAPPTPDR